MDKPLIHPLNRSEAMKKKKLIGISAAIVIAGIVSGYQFSRWTGGNASSNPAAGILSKGDSDAPKMVGVDDAQTFRDSTEGMLEAGGVDGEGTHKLIRPGGESQTVYLTSSVLDLSQYEGKQVRVWGETHAAQKAGWLMDVGKIELL